MSSRSSQYENSSKYLYLRTRLNLAHQARLVTDLVRFLGCPVDFLLPSAGNLWSNGVVIRFYSPQPPEYLCEYLAANLREFATWAMHDGNELACEPHGGGPVCLHYTNSNRFDEPMAQVFVQYHEHERDHEAVKDVVRSALGPNARSVFFFENGCVFMLPTDQPARLLIRRFERIRKRLKSVIVCNQSDHETLAFPNTGSQCWKTLRPAVRESDDAEDELSDNSIDTEAGGRE